MKKLRSLLSAFLCTLPTALLGLTVSAAEVLPATGQKNNRSALVAVLVVAGVLILAVILLSILAPRKKKDNPSDSDRKQK